MIRHKYCDGYFQSFSITGHNYCFMRCSSCKQYLGGKATEQKVNKLMNTKINPAIKRNKRP
jgi:hypothetical protein